MSDLRTLLLEAREEINAALEVQSSPELKLLVNRIDVALSEPAPEPVAWVYRREDGTFRVSEIMPHEDAAFPVYRAAPPPVSPSEARDAARLTDERLRQMLEDYRDAWSPGARDELFAQYKAEIAAIEREGGT